MGQDLELLGFDGLGQLQIGAHRRQKAREYLIPRIVEPDTAVAVSGLARR